VNKTITKQVYFLIILLLTVELGFSQTIISAKDKVINIGVLAHRGKERAILQWTPTAKYLSEKINGYHFKIIPAYLDELSTFVKHNRIQFVLTNPGNYVFLESNFGVSRILTMQTEEEGRTLVRYGAVIITRADNNAIQKLEDLKGKSFMAVSAKALGGFQMAWRELKEHGVDPFTDFSNLDFAGLPQDNIILAVKHGKVDAATARAETLVRMSETGKVSMYDFRILNPQYNIESPFPLSTRLYPEWPLSTLPATPRHLASKVTQALLSMDTHHPAAQIAHMAGWTIPLDYSPVHELMKNLQIGPYVELRQTSFLAIVKRYAWWLIIMGAFIISLIFLNGYISRTNHRLKETERNLLNEIVERKRSQNALSRYRDTLEEQVETRTNDLRKTNMGLEKSRVALRELVRISSAPDLSHDERLARLLDTGREYYDLPIAVLASIETDKQTVCKISGDTKLAPKQGGPLHQKCASILIKCHGEPLDIPNIKQAGPTPCMNDAWHSYLGTAVLVEGQAHCTLEFAGTQVRDKPLSKWDHELLKVMAQWIGDELERHEAFESERRHRSEIARASRLSTIGEMAASLAHELNQPLTGAINYSSGCLRMLKSSKYDSRKLMLGMERAIEGATLAANIIRHIREFVQKEDTQHNLVNLNSIINSATTFVLPEARRHKVNIQFELDRHLPPILGNNIQLEQVILNFIRNSFDAMESIKSEKRLLTITSQGNGETILFSVSDSGEGISKENLSKIFDAFYTTKSDGMGIGLSISRSIIESHRGKIAAKSLPQGGAEFSFELPAAEIL